MQISITPDQILDGTVMLACPVQSPCLCPPPCRHAACSTAAGHLARLLPRRRKRCRRARMCPCLLSLFSRSDVQPRLHLALRHGCSSALAACTLPPAQLPSTAHHRAHRAPSLTVRQMRNRGNIEHCATEKAKSGTSRARSAQRKQKAVAPQTKATLTNNHAKNKIHL